MLDFNDVELLVPEKYSFVGIEKRGDALQFCLPKGFSKHLDEFESFEKKRDLFFLLYRVLDKFKNISIEKGYIADGSNTTARDRDGLLRSKEGSEIAESEEEENIFYSKLDLIGGILEAYDELKILSLAYRLGKTEEVDHSKIHKFLHQAVFLPNNAAYVDYMVLPRPQVQFEKTDIVAMYCYIFQEIKLQIEEEVKPEIIALAEDFRQHYIASEYGLFDEQYFDQVLDTLKEALELIERNTPLKDPDYWEFHDAIELFLYGELTQTEEGEIWGIKNFHSVWESICLTWLIQRSYVLHVDIKFIPDLLVSKWKATLKNYDISKAFCFNQVKLIPDALTRSDKVDLFDRTYKIYKDNWDDSDYRTTFKYRDFRIKVARPSQNKFQHIAQELQREYESSYTEITIHKRLPKPYYSFWDVSKHAEDIQAQFLLMHYFNHFFSIAIEGGAISWEGFLDVVLKPIGISVDSYNQNFIAESPEAEVFTRSLFRSRPQEQYNFYYRPVEIKQMFDLFVKKYYEYYVFLYIIDIKYSDSEYFFNPKNIEEIKSRSVRKQFVYEHLVQKALEKDQVQSAIKSTFWLPGCLQSSIEEDGPKFMDGYIKLKQLDFIQLAKIYLNS